jgi:hypothetical protein
MPTKKPLKKEIMEDITEKRMEKLQDMVNQKVQKCTQEILRCSQIKTWEDTETSKWTQRGLQQTSKWSKGDYKKRHIWNKEDSTRYERGVEQRQGKNLRKKNQTETLEIKSPYNQIKNTIEGHSSRLEQIEDRISELKDKRQKKQKKSKSKNSRAVKGIFNNSVTPSKDQIWESWALKKEKRCKWEGHIVYSTK